MSDAADLTLPIVASDALGGLLVPAMVSDRAA